MNPTELANVKIKSIRILNDAEAYVKRKHNLLSNYESFENFAVNADEVLSKSDFNGLLHHILQIRISLAKKLWSKGVFVSTSILDESIFHESQNSPVNIAQAVIQQLATSHSCAEGFVLYPIHGFGLEMPFFLDKNSNLKSYILSKELGFCVAAQSNGFEQMFSTVKMMTGKLGIRSKINRDDIEHYARPSQMHWLQSNPLLMVKLASHTGAMFENQFIYKLKIRIAASLLVMLSSIENEKSNKIDKHRTSSSINNYETLDISHYIIGEATFGPKKPLNTRHVPMNLSATDLARLSDINVDLSSDELSKYYLKTASIKISNALAYLEKRYIKHNFTSAKNGREARVYARIMTALDWYRQSFGHKSSDHEAVVFLAVAFETLLADKFERGVDSRMQRRVRICLKGQHGVKDYADAVFDLIRARGAIVHNGSTMKQADLIKSQVAFAKCFIHLVGLLPNLNAQNDMPIANLLAD